MQRPPVTAGILSYSSANDEQGLSAPCSGKPTSLVRPRVATGATWLVKPAALLAMALAIAAGCSSTADDEGASRITGGSAAGVGGGVSQVDGDSDGYTEADGDCDDSNPEVHPGAIELCHDGMDNNCNGAADGDEPDGDGDGYGPCGGDCDDSDGAVGPHETEIAGNGLDDDCDGVSVGGETGLGVHGEQLDLSLEPDGDLHVAYRRGDAIRYLRQVDGVWDAERTVPGSSSTYHSRFVPRIAADSTGAAHFAWANWTITTVHYNSFANSWSGLEDVITEGDGAPDTNRCDIAVDRNDRVVVAAQSDFAIEYSEKPVGGAFGTETAVFYNHPKEPQSPTLEASRVSDELLCVYSNGDPGASGLQANVLSSGSWGADQRPTDVPDCCPNYNSAAIDAQGRGHIVWIRWTDPSPAADEEGYGHLEYVHQRADGSWSTKQTLIEQQGFFTCEWGECPHPQVGVADSGAVMVLYADGDPVSSRAKYLLKLPGKNGFESVHVDLTSGSAYQNWPAMVVDGNTFHVVWEDGRGELYHRSITIEATAVSAISP